MEKQGGAALVVVMAVLAMSLMLGLSGMQSSLIDERLAGNYKALSEAQLGAERAAAMGWGVRPGSDDFIDVAYTRAEVEAFEWMNFIDDRLFDDSAFGDGACDEPVDCYYRLLRVENKYYIAAKAAGASSESDTLFVEVGFTSPSPSPSPPSVSSPSLPSSSPFPFSEGMGDMEQEGEEASLSSVYIVSWG